jgi:hypothetical protein
MTTPLFHITTPQDENPLARLAPLQIALECLAHVDEWHLRRSLRGAQKGTSDTVIPPIYASGVTPRRPARSRASRVQADWLDTPAALALGEAGPEDIAAWRTAELRVGGIEVEPVIDHLGRCCVRWPDGTVEDPLEILSGGDDNKDRSRNRHPRRAGSVTPAATRPRDLPDRTLVHLTLPDADDGSHFAPLQIALEGLAQIDEWQIRHSLRRAEKGLSDAVIPPLYASGITYEEELPGHEDWFDVLTALRVGRHVDCEDLAAWRAGELRVAGIPVEPVIKWQWIPRETMIAQGYPPDKLPDRGVWLVHCCVRWPDGSIEDPSKILGMGGNFTQRI